MYYLLFQVVGCFATCWQLAVRRTQKSPCPSLFYTSLCYPSPILDLNFLADYQHGLPVQYCAYVVLYLGYGTWYRSFQTKTYHQINRRFENWTMWWWCLPVLKYACVKLCFLNFRSLYYSSRSHHYCPMHGYPIHQPSALVSQKPERRNDHSSSASDPFYSRQR
jgi:hypothetical protein